MENPVSDVVRIRDGRKEIVTSAKITLEGWRFGVIRLNGQPDFQTTAYLNGHYVEPPNHIKAEAHRIAGRLFSETRSVSRVHPSQGVLIL